MPVPRTCTVRLDDRRAGRRPHREADDGTGLADAATPGVGLSSMRERAAETGGTFRVEPGPDGGTRVLARLPLTGGA